MKTQFDLDARARYAIHAPAADTPAVVSLAADANETWALVGLQWSYSGTPSAGNLTVAIGGTTVLNLDINTGGPGFLPVQLYGAKNQALVATLATGGSGISGKLNVQYK